MTALLAGQHSAALRLGITDAEYQAHRAAGESYCYLCRKWLFEGRFYKLPSGAIRRQGCKPCWRAYVAAWKARRRERRQARRGS